MAPLFSKLAKFHKYNFPTRASLADNLPSSLPDPYNTVEHPKDIPHPLFDDASTPAARNVVWYCAGKTDPGLSRDNNEDTFICDKERGLFAVIDGMGGMAAGEEASAIARREIITFFSAERMAVLREAKDEAALHEVKAALMQANQAILECAKYYPHKKGMGAAAVVALIINDRIYLGNVGDCRAYGVSSEQMPLWTRDQTLAALLIEQGELTLQEARHHGARHQLLAALGEQSLLEPVLSSRPIPRGENLLLCSDGLWEMLDDETMQMVITQHPDPVNTLIDAPICPAGATTSAPF